MFNVARTNYVGVFGTVLIETAAGVGSGCLFQNSSTRFGDVLDGLSNTLLTGEHGSRSDLATWVGAIPGAHRNMARVVNTARRVPNHVPNDLSDFSSSHPGGAKMRGQVNTPSLMESRMTFWIPPSNEADMFAGL